MRTHRLEELSIPGRERALQELPDFDFYRLRVITELHLWPDPHDTNARHLDVTSLYEADSNEYAVTIGFRFVHRVTLPELIPTIYFGELDIEDVSADQMEGIRYRVKDHCMSNFEVLCKGIEIVGCSLANPLGELRALSGKPADA